MSVTKVPRLPGRHAVVRPVDAQRRGWNTFFLLPAMTLAPSPASAAKAPAGPERSGGGEALPSVPGTGILLSSRRKQENHAPIALPTLPAPQTTPLSTRLSRPKLSLTHLSRNWGPLHTPCLVTLEWFLVRSHSYSSTLADYIVTTI